MTHHEVPRKTELEKGRDRPNGWATPISSNDSFLEKWCSILPIVKESTQHCNSYLTIPLIFMWNSFVVSKFVKLSDELINYVSGWSGDDYYHFRRTPFRNSIDNNNTFVNTYMKSRYINTFITVGVTIFTDPFLFIDEEIVG